MAYLKVVKEELMLYLLEEMSQDGGLVVGFGVFIPFEEKEMEMFFLLVDRAKAVEEEMRRVARKLPSLRLLTREERNRDWRALNLLQTQAEAKEDALSKDIAAFRQQVLDRFKASRK